MNNDETRQRRPVMRRATEAGCPGWTPIAHAANDQAPATARPGDTPAAAPDSAVDARPLPATDAGSGRQGRR